MTKEREVCWKKLLYFCQKEECSIDELLVMHKKGTFHLGRSYYLQAKK